MSNHNTKVAFIGTEKISLSDRIARRVRNA